MAYRLETIPIGVIHKNIYNEADGTREQFNLEIGYKEVDGNFIETENKIYDYQYENSTTLFFEGSPSANLDITFFCPSYYNITLNRDVFKKVCKDDDTEEIGVVYFDIVYRVYDGEEYLYEYWKTIQSCLYSFEENTDSQTLTIHCKSSYEMIQDTPYFDFMDTSGRYNVHLSLYEKNNSNLQNLQYTKTFRKYNTILYNILDESCNNNTNDIYKTNKDLFDMILYRKGKDEKNKSYVMVVDDYDSIIYKEISGVIPTKTIMEEDLLSEISKNHLDIYNGIIITQADYDTIEEKEVIVDETHIFETGVNETDKEIALYCDDKRYDFDDISSEIVVSGVDNENIEAHRYYVAFDDDIFLFNKNFQMIKVWNLYPHTQYTLKLKNKVFVPIAVKRTFDEQIGDVSKNCVELTLDYKLIDKKNIENIFNLKIKDSVSLETDDNFNVETGDVVYLQYKSNKKDKVVITKQTITSDNRQILEGYILEIGNDVFPSESLKPSKYLLP